MIVHQLDLDGAVADTLLPDTLHGKCVLACYLAKEDRCVCKCNGEFHGQGRPNLDQEHVVDQNKGYDFAVAETQTQGVHPDNQPPTLEWYRGLIKRKDCDCNHWKRSKKPMPDLSTLPIEHYDHDGGWPVLGFKERQWLYVTCPRCGYQWALWKLGVSRNAGEPLQ